MKRTKTYSIGSLILFLIIPLLLRGQSWDKRYDKRNNSWHVRTTAPVLSTPDGGFAFTQTLSLNGSPQSSFYTYLLKADADGSPQIETRFADPNLQLNFFDAQLLATPNEGMAIFGSFDSIQSHSGGLFFRQIHKNGQSVFLKTHNQALRHIQTIFNLQNEFISLVHDRVFLEQSHLVKWSAQGTVIWSKRLSTNILGDAILSHPDGGYWVVGHSLDSLVAMRVNEAGNLIWQKSFDALSSPVIGLFLTKEQDIQCLTKRGFYLLDTQAVILARRDLRPNDPLSMSATQTSDNGIALLMLDSIQLNEGLTMRLQKLDASGHELFSRIATMRIPVADKYWQVAQAASNGFVAVGQMGQEARVLRLTEDGKLLSNTISGQVFHDKNNDCRFQNEPLLRGWFVKAEQVTTQKVTWASTDAEGNYQLNLETGTYKLSLITPNALWSPCRQDTTISFVNFDNSATLNFAVKSASACAAMQVDMMPPLLRQCSESTYTIRYCNNGSASAEQAFVRLTLDKALSFVGASLPVFTQNGHELRFNLGDVKPNDCGQFTVQVRVACNPDVLIGQTLCSEVRIFPDTVCGVNHKGVSIVGSCSPTGDSVRFRVSNNGARAFSKRGVIIEDVIIFAVPEFQIPSGGTQDLNLPATGRTLRLLFDNDTTIITAAVEGCRTNQQNVFSTGYFNMFPESDYEPSVDKECQAIQSEFGGNEKQAYPRGYRDNRYILPATDLEYQIRFQNEKDDTVHTLIIRDTLSPLLNTASIEMGASSHAYEMALYGQGILKLSIKNAALPPKQFNEEGSRGFVKFRIKLKKDIPLGSEIFNTAAIYYDFDAPRLTNRTRHVVGKNFIQLTETDASDNISTLVYPNPMGESATIVILGQEIPKADFLLFDAMGKLVRREKIVGNSLDFKRSTLAKGLYFYRILDEKNTPLSIGKVIIQ